MESSFDSLIKVSRPTCSNFKWERSFYGTGLSRNPGIAHNISNMPPRLSVTNKKRRASCTPIHLCCEPMITWDWGEDQLCRFRPLYFQPLRFWSPWLGSAQPLSQKWPQAFSLVTCRVHKGFKSCSLLLPESRGLYRCWKNSPIPIYDELLPSEETDGVSDSWSAISKWLSCH